MCNYNGGQCSAICDAYCGPGVSCDGTEGACWQPGGNDWTSCGENGNFCSESCDVACHVFASPDLPCWFNDPNNLNIVTESTCGASVAPDNIEEDILRSLIQVCGNVCGWDTPCNTECMMLGGNQEEEDADYTSFEYFMTDCYNYGECNQCAKLCLRETSFRGSEVVQDDYGNEYVRVMVDDVTGLPASGYVKINDQLVSLYVGHNNKVITDEDAILYMPPNHQIVTGDIDGPVYPLTTVSTVHNDKNNFDDNDDLWLADTRAFPSENGTLILNPNCGPTAGSCSEIVIVLPAIFVTTIRA